MENEFGIKVISSVHPKKKIGFNDWVSRLGVSSMYQKKDYESSRIMNEYDFTKISEKKEKKLFGIIHTLFNFV